MANEITLRGFLRDIEFSHYQGNVEYEKANLICPRVGGKEDGKAVKLRDFYGRGFFVSKEREG